MSLIMLCFTDSYSITTHRECVHLFIESSHSYYSITTAGSQDMCSLELQLRLLRTLPEKMTQDYNSPEISNSDILYYGHLGQANNHTPVVVNKCMTKTLF